MERLDARDWRVSDSYTVSFILLLNLGVECCKMNPEPSILERRITGTEW